MTSWSTRMSERMIVLRRRLTAYVTCGGVGLLPLTIVIVFRNDMCEIFMCWFHPPLWNLGQWDLVSTFLVKMTMAVEGSPEEWESRTPSSLNRCLMCVRWLSTQGIWSSSFFTDLSEKFKKDWKCRYHLLSYCVSDVMLLAWSGLGGNACTRKSSKCCHLGLCCSPSQQPLQSCCCHQCSMGCLEVWGVEYGCLSYCL